MRPYLTLAGFTRRSTIAPDDLALVEASTPGFIEEQLLVEQEGLNALLLKRYAIPFGGSMGPPTADGTAPPPVVFGAPPGYGTPVSGDLQMVLGIQVPGPTSTAIFKWSADGGTTWTMGVPTAPAVVLAGTGLTVLFPATGSFSVDNVYKSSTPVPRKVLQWLVDLVSLTAYRRRGANASNDEMLKQFVESAVRARDEMRQAADAKDGLFELPLNADAAASAVVSPAPLMSSDASPYAFFDRQRCRGNVQDGNIVR